MRNHLSPDEIAARLRYAPDEGTLYWRTTGPHHKAGDEAGTVTRDGNVWVTISGRKYAGRDLVWCLTTGKWSERPLRMVSDTLDLSPDDKRRRRQDLTIANIEPYTPVLSDRPQAVRLRRLRAMHKIAKAGLPIGTAEHGYTDPSRPNITWSVPTGQWIVRDNSAVIARLPGTMRPYVTRELGRFATLDEARQFSDAQTRRLEYVISHPVPNLVPDMRERMAAGDKYFGMTLYEAHNTFAYNPDTGELIWRTPPAFVGLPAGKPGATVAALYVSLHGRRYPVHYLAWFLTHAVWPGRKALSWRNGDQTDNRLSNLFLINEA